MKNWAKKGKIAAKKWFLGLQKSWVDNQSRKAKWYKMQVVFLKLNMM